MRTHKRFWSKVDTSGDCWTWLGCHTPEGYGRFHLDGKLRYAHRCAYQLTTGPVHGFIIMHSCDNPSCVRPSHLQRGTQAENMRECLQKGRTTRGGKRVTCLQQQAREDIVKRRAAGETCTALAREYGVSKSLVSRIARGLR